MAEAEAWVMIPKSGKKATDIVIDMRPLVLCKDCKYGEETKNSKGESMIKCMEEFPDWLRNPDWFCADGERKSD